MKWLLGLLYVLTISGMVPLQAQNVGSGPYQATYEGIVTRGNRVIRQFTRKIAYDGYGRRRVECVFSNGKQTTFIIDGPSHRSAVIEGQMKLLLPMSNQTISNIADVSAGNYNFGGTSLAAKVIDGHPCHGRHTQTATGSEDAWIGDDIGLLVYSRTEGHGATTETRLRSYSASSPGPSAFMIPSGCVSLPHG